MHLKDALTKYQEVINNLEFARELQKSFVTLGQEVTPKFWSLSWQDIWIIVITVIINIVLAIWTRACSGSKGGKEDREKGTAAARGNGTAATEDGFGAAVHTGSVGWRPDQTGP